MRDKVVMVTGANAGMGREISHALAGMGANVVMVCRDRTRGEASRAAVESASGNREVELLVADLSSQKSIRQLVSEFEARHDRLHVLVNNVGITLPKRSETVDGIEAVFATNHLAPFLLTNLLLPLLNATPPTRTLPLSSSPPTMA